MRFSPAKSLLLLLLLCTPLGLANTASGITFPDPMDGPTATQFWGLQYGDFYAYSLPMLDAFAEPDPDAPGKAMYKHSDYYYISHPTNPQDPICIYTNANDVKDNPDNIMGFTMDNAYVSVTGEGAGNSFGTRTQDDPPTTTPPGTDVLFSAYDSVNHWDIEYGALINYLGPDDDFLLFYNHNQEGSGDAALFAWGQLLIMDTVPDDPENPLPTLYFDFNNYNTLNNPYLYSNTAGEGVPTGQEYNGPSDPGDYAYVRGILCFDADGNFVPDCSSPSVAYTLEFNKSGDDADFMLYSPEINDNLDLWYAMGYDMMRAEMSLNMLDDGPEELWILKGHSIARRPPPPIPEPATMLLMGSGLLGLAGLGRKKLRK
jgi:hypothetical protein